MNLDESTVRAMIGSAVSQERERLRKEIEIMTRETSVKNISSSTATSDTGSRRRSLSISAGALSNNSDFSPTSPMIQHVATQGE
jgi:hypothetical protein